MILVTGATGFIGSHLIDRLAAQGRPARCLVRRQVNLPSGMQQVHGDLSTGAGLDAALRDVDTVIHLAGVTKAHAADAYERGNAEATANLLRASGGVSRFVHVSSLAAAGPSTADRALSEEDPPHPVSIYGRSKLAGENAVRESPLAGRAIVIRPPVVYGPRDRDVFQAVKGVSRGWMIVVGREPRRFSHIYVGDLVDGLLAAADSTAVTHGMFYLADPAPVTWQEFSAAAAGLMQCSFRTVHIGESAAHWLGFGAEAWSRVTGKPGILSRDKIREGVCPGWVCDPSRARRELGFVAPTNLEEGLRRTLAWYKESGWLRF